MGHLRADLTGTFSCLVSDNTANAGEQRRMTAPERSDPPISNPQVSPWVEYFQAGYAGSISVARSTHWGQIRPCTGCWPPEAAGQRASSVLDASYAGDCVPRTRLEVAM
jgi:hypothetical protein